MFWSWFRFWFRLASLSFVLTLTQWCMKMHHTHWRCDDVIVKTWWNRKWITGRGNHDIMRSPLWMWCTSWVFVHVWSIIYHYHFISDNDPNVLHCHINYLFISSTCETFSSVSICAFFLFTFSCLVQSSSWLFIDFSCCCLTHFEKVLSECNVHTRQ